MQAVENRDGVIEEKIEENFKFPYVRMLVSACFALPRPVARAFAPL
jgi:hypothetical protein